jgi:hypothetical protein
MSISITYNPPKLQPVLSNGLFYTASSTKVNEFKFRFVWDIYVNQDKVGTLKNTPNPNGLGILDLSQFLETFLDSNVDVSGTTPSSQYEIHKTEKYSLQDRTKSKPPIIDVYALVGEEYATGATEQVLVYNGITDTPGVPSFITGPVRVYNGSMVNNYLSRSQTFDMSPYILRDTSNIFLTQAPRIQNVLRDDYFTLSFFNYVLFPNDQLTSLPRQAEFNFYDTFGNLITGHTIDNIISEGGGPWTAITETDASVALRGITGITYNILNLGVGPKNLSNLGILPSGTTYYDVKLLGKGIDTTGTTLSGVSEVFNFNIEEDCLRFNQLQLTWLNRYGAFDYFRFRKGKSEGVKIERQVYQKYQTNWGQATPTNDPSHPTKSRGNDIFNVNVIETHVLNSGLLNFPDFQYLEGLYTSSNVYIIEKDGSLTPIVITSTDFIRKNRGNRNLVNLELTYEYSNNVKLNR